MSTTLRAFVAPLVAVLSLALAGTATAGPSASIEQVRNGQATAGPSTPAVNWVSGNAGGSNSHYLESHSIAYRTVMDGLPTDGTVVELVVGYAVKKSDSYAIDFLTQYQRLLPHVGFGHSVAEVINPLSGVTGVNSTVTTAQIPLPTKNLMIDPDGAESEPAALQPSTSMAQLSNSERVMTLFGGTLIDVTYVSEGDVSLATGTSETQVKVRFIPTSPKAVLAWGGHIACRWDWGFNPDGTPRSAGGISGSSYHMTLVTWNLGSLGSQDRSLSTDAVYPVPHCGVSNLGPFCAGSTNTHTAPAGMASYHWELFDNTSGATIVGSDSSTSVVVRSATGGNYSLLLITGASGFTKQCQGTFTVLPPAMSDAGLDQNVCSTSPQVQLAGQASGGGSTVWSGGAGSFSPSASVLNATYTPSASEITAGSVTLTLTSSYPGGTCPPATDKMIISIQRAPTANAGVDLTVCASSPLAQLAGSVGGSATGGTWTGGAGTFSPSASALNATYLPSAEEIAAGRVTLTLTSITAGGPCAQATDQMTILISPAATVNAGADLTVCTSSAQAQLAGSVGGGAASGMWSGGAGSYNPNASNLNAIYTPTAAEIAAGGVTLTLTTNDPAGPCPAVNDQVRINISPAATANAGVDLTVCSISAQAQLAGVVGGGATSGAWSGGDGSFSPDASTLNAIYTPTAAEIAAGGVTLTLTTNDPAGPCAAGVDQVHITISPAAVADAGVDVTVCSSGAQVQLAASVSGGATSGLWSGGGGSYSPNASSLTATYTPSAAEIAAGGVTLTLTTNDPAGPCAADIDQVHITISPLATVNAGVDQSLCSTSPQAQLAGVVGGGATSGTWSGGGGSFNPSASSLNAIYTPTAAEIAAGGVTLTLTTNDPAGPCVAATDQVRINILPAATVSAGIDQSLCATSPQVQLAGTVGGGATSGMWSGGGGSYSPNASTLNAIYTPTAAEIAGGNFTLTLTTNDPAGPCAAMSDQVRINVFPAAVANAGVDQSLCSSSAQAQLAGVVSGGATSGTWSGGNGSFNPSASSLNAIYTPTAAEIAAGGVTLTLTTNDPAGPCAAQTDQVRLNILPAAVANAGADQTVCATSPQVQLAGAAGGGATSGMWSGGSGSFSPNATNLNPTYTPSAAEIAAGSVTLTFTTNDPAGPCAAGTDQVRITIVPAATVNAGPDQALCSSSPRVQLNGSVGGSATGGIWSGGTGTFSPSATSLGGTYTPSAVEIANGSVTLTLTTTPATGPCPPVSDQVTILFSPAATVNAGPDQSACAAFLTDVQLAGSFGGGATSATWSGGTGTFAPSASDLNARYTPSASERAGGSVTLTLTTNDPAGPCPAVSDQMKISIVSPRVTVADRAMCKDMTAQMCANASNGVAPYRYLWNNGVTTQCMTVADTGRYTVTITDAMGCQATGSGMFRFRDCPGMLAHTSTTCGQFLDGTASPLLDGDVNWGTRNNIISTISPGVFFYFTKVTAPSSSFTVDIVQAKDNPGFPFCEVQQGQVALNNGECNRLPDGTVTSPGQASVTITGATAGQVYVINVKYTLKNLIGTYMDETMGCHYDFKTVINGVEVDRDPEGLQIGVPKPVVVTEEPYIPEESTNDTRQRGSDTNGGVRTPSSPDTSAVANEGDIPEESTDNTRERGGETNGGLRGTGSPDTAHVWRGVSVAPGTGSSPAPGEALAGVSNSAWESGFLERAVPNPFSASMRMAYDVGSADQQVNIGVYDIAGRLVRSLASDIQSAGRHAVVWDGRDQQGSRVMKGMYFVHMRIGDRAKQVRVTMLQ